MFGMLGQSGFVYFKFFLPQKIIISYNALDYDYVNEYVLQCVKRRVHFEMLGNIDFQRVLLVLMRS